MSNIKFHLHKFDKRLYFQMIHIDASLINKAYKKEFENYFIIIGAVSEWSQQIGIYSSGANCGPNVGHTRKLTYLLSTYERGHLPVSIELVNNEERDLMYNRIIEMYKYSLDNNLWINK